MQEQHLNQCKDLESESKRLPKYKTKEHNVRQELNRTLSLDHRFYLSSLIYKFA